MSLIVSNLYFYQYELSICAIFRDGARFLKEWYEFHFDSSRFQYLAKVLSSLSTFPRADIILVTNKFSEQDLLALQNVYNEILPNGVGGGSVSIRSYGNLAHPFDLTWSHKEIIAIEFGKSSKSLYCLFCTRYRIGC